MLHLSSRRLAYFSQKWLGASLSISLRHYGNSSVWRDMQSSLGTGLADTPQLPVQIGQVFELRKAFSEEDVAAFANLTRDFNPIHVDNDAAKVAGFERAVVQGMLYAGMFPAIIGSGFPGSVYMSQTLRFVAPVFVGEPLLAKLLVQSVIKHRRRYRVTFDTMCYKNESTLVLDGAATALLLSGPVENSSQLS